MIDITTNTIELNGKGHTDIIDITGEVQQAINDGSFEEGNITVFAIGSTTGISTIEYEPGLVQHDVRNMLDQVAPYGMPYQHNKTWGDDNGAAHLRSTLMGTSYSIPFKNGQLILGTWQQIIFIDFDTRPRRRKVVVQIIGARSKS